METLHHIMTTVATTARLALAGAITVLLTALPAAAQDYPDKARVIKIVVPTGPGSALDLLARSYGKAMTDEAGLNTIVENRPGADGAIGVQTFLSQPADGYSLLLLSSSFAVIGPAINPRLPYNPLTDLQPLMTISKAGIVMSIGANAPYKSAREFVKLAKESPGKYTCATASPTLTMACEQLKASAGIDLLVVPYKTTAAATLAVASGEADVIFADAGSFISLWQGGKLKGAAFATAERVPAFPAIPTMREEGIPDFLMTAWYGVYVKAGTPPKVAATMRELLRKSGAHDNVKTALKTFVHEPLDLGMDEVTAMTRREIDGWAKLVRDRGLKFNN